MSCGFYIVPVVAGTATPDLGQGAIQEITLTEDTAIETPANLESGPFWMRLIQDSTGGWLATFSGAYAFSGTEFSGLGVPASTVVNLQLAVQDDMTISYLGRYRIIT